MSSSASGGELPTKVKELCGALLAECKRIVNGVEQGSTEEEFVVNAKSVAGTALNIGKLVAEHVATIPASKKAATELQQTFLLDYTAKLREAVVLLVKYARNLQSNPVDFLSKQSLGNTLKDVVGHTKSVMEAAVTLYDAETGIDADEESQKHSSAGGDSSFAPPTSPNAAEITKDLKIGSELADQSQVVLDALTHLSESIVSRDAETFNQTTKAAVTALQGLTTSLQKAVKTETALKALLEANLQVITAAKVYFKKPNNEQLAEKFEGARNDVITAMRQLLFEVSKSNARVSRTLSRGISEKRLSGVLRQGIITSGQSPKMAKKDDSPSKHKPDSTPKLVVEEVPSPTGKRKASPEQSPNPSPTTSPSLNPSVRRSSVSEGADEEDHPKAGESGGLRRRGASKHLSPILPRAEGTDTEDANKNASTDSPASSSPPNTLSPQMAVTSPSTKKRGSDSPDSERKKDKKRRDKDKEKMAKLIRTNSVGKSMRDAPLKDLVQSEDSVEDSDDISESAPDSPTSAKTTVSTTVSVGSVPTAPPAPASPASASKTQPPLTSSPSQVTILSRSAPASGLQSRPSGSLGALDKNAIAHRILDVIKQKFPAFATEWSTAENAAKMSVEAKIVAELALYHIAVLQEVPGAQKTGSPTPAAGPSKTMHPAAQAIALANMQRETAAASEESKKKDRPVNSSKRTDKSKTALPGFMRLFGRGDDDSSRDPSKRKGSISSATPPAVDDLDETEKIRLQDQELERIVAMSDVSELGGMTLRLKGMLRLKKGKSSPAAEDAPLTARGEKDGDSKTKISTVSIDKIPDLAKQFSVAVQFLIMKIKDAIKATKEIDETQLYNTSHKTQGLLKSIVGFIREIAQDQLSSEAASQLIAKTEDEVERERTGKIQEVDPQLTTRGRYTKLVRKQLQQSLHRWCASLHYSASQINTDLLELNRNRNQGSEVDSFAESTIMHLCALVSTFLTTLEQTLNDMETLNYFAEDDVAALEDSSASTDSDSATEEVLSVAPQANGFWEGYEKVSADPKELFKPGQLNHFIAKIILVDDSINEFQNTFLETYNTFTSPDTLLSKFIEAFYPPKGKMDDAKISKHRRKLLEFMLAWVRYSRKYDFDARVSKRLKRFLDEAARTCPEDEASIKPIQEEMKKQETESDELDVFEELPKEISTYEADGANSFNYLLCFDALTIARQLTYIEFELYRRIDPLELKGQAWNKPKRQCVSRNVLSLIQRANRLSFWIATSILLQPKLKDRGRVVVKVISVAQQLKEMNNFNTLMGFVAGLNMSSISRLKATFNQVSKRSLDQYKALQELLDPKSSFKSLRDAIRNGGTTILPYIGTTLSDLTFMEDGNPDFVDEAETMINMEKRRLVSNAINNVKMYQNSNFKIQPRDPAYTFLVELPSLSEQTLYRLSLEREPRETTSTRSK